MKIIQNLISTPGELKLPISAGAFESALQHNTYPATSDDISGHVVKFDEENYAQKFYGRIGGGQFQLRPVRKAPRMEMANFLINGSYEPADPDTVRVDDAMESWLFPSNFGLGGMALLIIAGLGYRNRTRLITSKKQTP